MDYAFLKWIGEALGPWAPVVLILLYYAHQNKDKNTDVAGELIGKIDDLRDRVARIEGKLDK